MRKIRLLHWKKAEASDHIDTLRLAGYEVAYDEQFRSDLIKQWRRSPPDAFVIDLSRLPSHGRELAIAIRQSPKTRHVPLVFCGGESAKVEQIRAILPDASYCDVRRLAMVVRRSLERPVVSPVRPTDMMNRYATRTTAEKLGISAGATVALINAPRDAMAHIGALPPSVAVLEETEPNGVSITICFLESPEACLSEMSRIRKLAKGTKLWFLWRKGGSARNGDITETLVRETGISLGLVDYKICSVSSTWSAMLFALKSKDAR